MAARLDGRRFIEFPHDVGQGDRVTGTPERLLGRVDLAFAELEHPSVLAYPLATHFAEQLTVMASVPAMVVRWLVARVEE